MDDYIVSKILEGYNVEVASFNFSKSLDYLDFVFVEHWDLILSRLIIIVFISIVITLLILLIFLFPIIFFVLFLFWVKICKHEKTITTFLAIFSCIYKFTFYPGKSSLRRHLSILLRKNVKIDLSIVKDSTWNSSLTVLILMRLVSKQPQDIILEL